MGVQQLGKLSAQQQDLHYIDKNTEREKFLMSFHPGTI
jgi:hypothetical protein